MSPPRGFASLLDKAFLAIGGVEQGARGVGVRIAQNALLQDRGGGLIAAELVERLPLKVEDHVGAEGIECHGAVEAGDRLLGPADVVQDEADPGEFFREARIERDHFLRRAHSFVVASGPEASAGERPECKGIALVELHREPGGLVGLLEALLGRGAPPAGIGVHFRRAEEGVGGSEAGVEFDRPPQQPFGFNVARTCVAPPQLASTQEAVVNLLIASMLGGDILPIVGAEVERQRGDDSGRHVVLHGEDVGELTVEAFGP